MYLRDPMRIIGWIPVVIVLGIFGYTFYSFVFQVWQLGEPLTPSGLEIVRVISLLIYFTSLFLCLWSYFKIVMTNPGTVSGDQSRFNLSGDNTPEQSVRMCKHCQQPKPPRAHHCSICKHCILRMDHHCPWVNNCVGWYNHKFFILFCFWASIVCVSASLSMLILVSVHGFSLFSQSVQTLVTFIFAATFSFVLVGFVLQHGWMVCKNVTTLEFLSLQRKVGFCCPLARIRSPYDVGRMSNFKQMFGERWPVWLLPVHSQSSTIAEWQDIV